MNPEIMIVVIVNREIVVCGDFECQQHRSLS